MTATGIGPQAALNLSLDVLDASGNTVTTSSPISSFAGWPPVSTGMDAKVTLPAAQGTYYLRVDGVGQGAPATTAWSDYGSLGQWRLTSNGCASRPVRAHSTRRSRRRAHRRRPRRCAPSPALKRPGAPIIRAGSSGTTGGISTAIARWSAPTTNGGTPITKYRLRAQRRNSANQVVATTYSGYFSPTARSSTRRLTAGRYTFAVMTWNKVGSSPWSKNSTAVLAR